MWIIEAVIIKDNKELKIKKSYNKLNLFYKWLKENNAYVKKIIFKRI